MVTAVKSVEEKVKELSKSTKRSQQKVESDCKFVMDRVGEMTMGVQVIAENLDSVNDVAKKVELLDQIETSLTQLGKLDEISAVRAIVEKVRVEREETGWGEPSSSKGGMGQ